MDAMAPSPAMPDTSGIDTSGIDGSGVSPPDGLAAARAHPATRLNETSIAPPQ
jgi:hypothetical protein